jgi:methionyl-tRNA formyltransferase
MKQIIFIGNRLNVFEVLIKNKNIYLKKIYVLKDSLLHKKIVLLEVNFEVFEINNSNKKLMIDYLKHNTFDLLISNGCPFILPIEKLKKTNPKALFINTHPTFLPHLKGATPLNGVIFLGYNFIGATTHYMDSGIDSGNIIYQEKIDITPDLDQGLIYYLSFILEGKVFSIAFDTLINNNYLYKGEIQKEHGSYFNREETLFEINILSDSNETILKKIKSLGMTTLPNNVILNKKKYKVHDGQVIENEVLLKLFASKNSGTVLYEYSDKILVKTNEGIIKMSIVL